MEIVKSWIVNNTHHSQYETTQLVMCLHFGVYRYFIWTSYNQWLEISEYDAQNTIANSVFLNQSSNQ